MLGWHVPLHRDASPASTGSAFPGPGCLQPNEGLRRAGVTPPMQTIDDQGKPEIDSLTIAPRWALCPLDWQRWSPATEPRTRTGR
jgi:hypothetical protein